MAVKIISIVSRMNLGGVGVLLSDLHDELVEPEFTHVLITGMCAQNEIDMLLGKEKDSTIIQLDRMGRAPSLFGDISTFFSIRQILRRVSPDIVHTHTSKAGVIGRLAALSLRQNISIVHTFHGHHLYGYFSKYIVKLIVIVERLIAVRTDLLIADSTQVMKDLIKVDVRPKKQWKVIPPGIRDFKIISKKDARQKLGVEHSTFLICWIGRFAEIKNPMLALQAFNKLPVKSRETLKMIMVGEGTLMEESKKFANENNLNIIFPGWESNIEPYLAAADVLLVTSRNEGFGMVIAEAGFFGIPCISTDVGGVREFIEDGTNGILTQGSPNAIAAHILELSMNPMYRDDLGSMAREKAIKKFSVETFIQSHKKEYLDLIK